jgi:hypothetical protein
MEALFIGERAAQIRVTARLARHVVGHKGALGARGDTVGAPSVRVASTACVQVVVCVVVGGDAVEPLWIGVRDGNPD